MAGDFAFQGESGLLDAWGDEIWGEGGNVVGDALGKSGGKIAGDRGWVAACERVGIHGKYLMIIVIRVVENTLRVGDAIFSGDCRVVDLWNANLETSVA